MSRTTRRINSTGRTRILSGEVDLRRARSGFALWVRLRAGLHDRFPSSSRVVADISQRYHSVRGDLGVLGKLSGPTRVDLSALDPHVPPKFRLKIVDQENRPGRLLGATSRFLPRLREDAHDAGADSIIAVQAWSLGERLWRLDFEERDVPVLYYNEKLVGFKDSLVQDPVVSGLLMPEVVYRVLEELRLRGGEGTDDASTWQGQWLNWIRRELGVSGEPDWRREDGSAPSDQYKIWVRGIMEGFCNKHRLARRAARALVGISSA